MPAFFTDYSGRAFPVWKLREESRWAGMVYMVFPGNVGDSSALVDVVEMLNPEE